MNNWIITGDVYANGRLATGNLGTCGGKVVRYTRETRGLTNNNDEHGVNTLVIVCL